MSSPSQLNPHLPPHLREVCSLLALGLLRLRSRREVENAADAANAGADGESSLHFVPEQSGGVAHATRRAA
jgi:hypothetical protein